MNIKNLCRSFLILGVSTLLGLSSSSSTGLTNISQTPDASVEERELKVVTSSQMRALKPVTITAIRNIKSKNWINDLEIEVQNTLAKPIYALHIILEFPDIPKRLVDGELRGTVTTITYGRLQLTQRNEFATSEDAPINPGEKLILKIPEPQRLGLESVLAKTNLSRSDIKKINLLMRRLSYGDGTGFKTGKAFSYPRTSSRNSFPRDGPTINSNGGVLSLKQSFFSKKALAPNLKPTGYTTPSANPVFVSCNPHVSGCQLYEEVFEGCPTPANPCTTKIFFRDATALTPEPVCLGHINHPVEEVTCGGITISMSP